MRDVILCRTDNLNKGSQTNMLLRPLEGINNARTVNSVAGATSMAKHPGTVGQLMLRQRLRLGPRRP